MAAGLDRAEATSDFIGLISFVLIFCFVPLVWTKAREETMDRMGRASPSVVLLLSLWFVLAGVVVCGQRS